MNNRVLKFRIWDKPNKCFSTATIFTIQKLYPINPHNFVVQQFTGLLDKNNKEIYEGDIIKVSELHQSQQAGPGKRQILQTFDKAIVTWKNGSYYYSPIRNVGHNIPHQLLFYGYEKEIIGNIFENPELIK